MSSVTTRLEDTIHENMERSGVSGLAIALVKNGELVAAEGYGIANIETGEPVQPSTRLSIQSVTKTIVATAIVQLRDRSLLDLDAPVNVYIAPRAVTNKWEAEAPVTARRLLTHTAGFPVGLPMPGKLPIADFIAQFARTTYRPGTDMIYANIGFDIAGVLIERLSGRPVDDYLREAIFEPLMTYDYLARPAKLSPRAAEAMPTISDQARTYVFKIRKGIYFAPDPVFKGKPRELTAEDYAYTIKRFRDPANKSPYESFLGGVLGLDEVKKDAERTGKFDYDRKVEGLQVLDRYTLKIKLKETDYNFAHILALPNTGAVAREAIEAYADDTNAHPVGTGP